MTGPAPVIADAERPPDSLIAEATVRFVLADLAEDDRAAFSAGEAAGFLAFAQTLNGNHRHRARLAVRDRCIVQLNTEFGLTPAEIEEYLSRYAGAAWPRDRRLAAMPDRYRGRAAALIWTAFQCWPSPLRRRAVEYILADATAQKGRRSFCADNRRISS